MQTEPSPAAAFDALLPPDMAAKAEQVGARKARMPAVTMAALAVLAGAFIGLGAVFATVVGAGAGDLPFGVGRALTGLAFSLGLILVVIGGAELFTGNALMVMAWASGRVSTSLLLRNWAIVYVGNFAGAAGTAGLVFAAGHYAFGRGAVGLAALTTADAKCALDFGQAFALGVLCNALVCLAVWLTYSARSTVDRIAVIVPPITAFVAAGFEHSIANMYFVPVALLVKAWAPESFWRLIGRAPGEFANLTLERFLMGNLLPVTLGNIVGGAVLVGAAYWFVYRRATRG